MNVRISNPLRTNSSGRTARSRRCSPPTNTKPCAVRSSTPRGVTSSAAGSTLQAWDMLQFSLRLGDAPRAVVTTAKTPLLKRLVGDSSTSVTHATTEANAANLSPSFLAEVTRRYAGTATGAQELEGKIIEDHSGGLWRRDARPVPRHGAPRTHPHCRRRRSTRQFI